MIIFSIIEFEEEKDDLVDKNINCFNKQMSEV